MPELRKPFVHVQNALTEDDIAFLKSACKKHLSQENMPCYVLTNNLDTPACLKIKRLLEEHSNEALHYLNDFYIYTDNSFGTGWHMDTELFTFENAINAWILLSPGEVRDPLCFIDQINHSPERYYHSIKMQDDKCVFRNYCNRNEEVRPLESIEAERIHTPAIRVGDILVFNPKRFHRTNVTTAKHCLSIKFVFGGKSGLLSDMRVPALFWPEVAIFRKLVEQTDRWEDVIEGIKQALKNPKDRKALSSGFYPEQMDLYKRMVQLL